jgi:hypothetical protein
VTVLSPGKGTGLNYARASQKTVVSPDGGTGFIDGVWHEPGPTAWQCQCGKLYTVTCISSKPLKREWVGLTLNEAEDFYDKYTDRAELINAIDKFLEEKNT